MSDLEKEAEELLSAGKIVCDQISDLPALYSIAVSLKRIADVVCSNPVMVRDLAEEELEALKKDTPSQVRFAD